MAEEKTSTQTIAAIIVIAALAILFIYMFMRSRKRSSDRQKQIFGHFRSISSQQAMLSRRQSAPSRLEQVIVQTPPSAEHESICSSILPRYDIEKPPPAYMDDLSSIEPENENSRSHSIDIADVIIRSSIIRSSTQPHFPELNVSCSLPSTNYLNHSHQSTS